MNSLPLSRIGRSGETIIKSVTIVLCGLCVRTFVAFLATSFTPLKFKARLCTARYARYTTPIALFIHGSPHSTRLQRSRHTRYAALFHALLTLTTCRYTRRSACSSRSLGCPRRPSRRPSAATLCRRSSTRARTMSGRRQRNRPSTSSGAPRSSPPASSPF